MAAVDALLLEFLEELSSKELHEFLRNLPSRKGALRSDDALPVVKQMIDEFGPEEAVTRTISNLRDIKQNQLARQLQALWQDTGKQINKCTYGHNVHKILNEFLEKNSLYFF